MSSVVPTNLSDLSNEVLDALVALNVMGLTPPSAFPDAWFGLAYYENGYELVRIDGVNMAWKPTTYSTDPWRSWTVVEKMRSKGWSFQIHGEPWPSAVVEVAFYLDEWVEYGDFSDDRTFFEATGLFPRAICEAALKAKDAT
jgi:hypothetical protein